MYATPHETCIDATVSSCRQLIGPVTDEVSRTRYFRVGWSMSRMIEFN